MLCCVLPPPSTHPCGPWRACRRKGLWAIKKKNGGKFPVHPKKAVAPAAPAKVARFYPADDVPKPLAHNAVHKPTKLRGSITPGTVLILLAGRFKGKRVVCLKQMPSGLLLVTGPFKLNGVPVRRVNQAYVIATSTKVALPALDLSAFGTDAKSEKAYFDPVEKKSDKKGEDKFFTAADAKKKELSQVRLGHGDDHARGGLGVLAGRHAGVRVPRCDHVRSAFAAKHGALRLLAGPSACAAASGVPRCCWHVRHPAAA